MFNLMSNFSGSYQLLRTLFTVHKSFVVCKYYPFAGIRM